MRKAILSAVVLLVVIAGSRTAFALSEEPDGLYSLLDAGRYDMFINNVDGYSLFVDKGMTVDMSYSSVCAVLENDDKRIEIYKQDVSGSGRMSYINYSNKFLDNWTEHQWEFSDTQAIGDYSAYVCGWSRNKLSRVENDKNHYACIEIGTGRYNYTIMIKADAPIFDLGGYSYLLENFKVEPVTAQGYTRTSSPPDVSSRGWNEETEAFYNTYFGDAAELTWGIFEPNTALFDYSKLQWYENYFNYKFPIILNYSEFYDSYQHPNLKQRLDTAYKYGKTLELTLQTTSTSDGGNMVYKVLNGEYDAFLRNYAQVVADFGHPVLFRLCNEMNGDWCLYSAYNTSKDTMIFKEFYEYVYSFFKDAGADNVIWIWNPNSASFPDFKWNDELMYYPGDEYVDIVGMTAYNTGTYYSHVGEKWREFHELYNDLYHKYCEDYGQPLMITEFASASAGGDKEQWVINMFGDIGMYDRIKVAVWWDGHDWDADGNVSRSYVMDETPELLDIFKQNLNANWRNGVFG